MIKRYYEFFERHSELERRLEEREEKERNKVFKVCAKCGERKSLLKFSRYQGRKDKRISVCKKCRIIEYLKYYYANREEILAKSKKYRETQDRSSYHREYRSKNKEKLARLAHGWYSKNKKKIKARNLKFYNENREACALRRKLWREKNLEKLKKYNREYYKLKVG
jgi:hypothetical protein